MTDFVEPMMCGIDVSMEMLDIALTEDDVDRIPNTEQSIAEWLELLPKPTCLAIEATGGYHETLLNLALENAVEVYVVNGKQLHHYREALGRRAKTDSCDAKLLRRYLCHEYGQLRPANALSKREKRLWQLLKRRAMLVKVRTQMRASMKGDDELERLSQGIVAEMGKTIRALEERMCAIVKAQGWEQEMNYCRSIPGIGLINALALVASFHRGTFAHVGQFIAYLGLDVRVKDSGKMRGKRKLTKRGESEIRRLLYTAAMTFARHPTYQPLFQGMRNRGMSTTASYVALARKLARIAYALMKKGVPFSSDYANKACVAT